MRIGVPAQEAKAKFVGSRASSQWQATGRQENCWVLAHQSATRPNFLVAEVSPVEWPEGQCLCSLGDSLLTGLGNPMILAGLDRTADILVIFREQQRKSGSE